MKLSHYEWDPENDLIAEGGFAEVFKAKDLNADNRWVALKIYKEAVSRGTTGSTGQKKYSLEQEFAKIDGLSHTNVISFYGLDYIEHKDAMGRIASYPVLIMEYASEGTLKELARKKDLEDNMDKIVKGIISAIGYLHDQGVIHRDLKPGNVLFSRDRNKKLVPKITDFGISKDILGDKTIEQSFTEGVGTPHYMAPEQFFKKKFGLNGEVSERTDIWAIGVVLYQLLKGVRPFGQNSKDYELIREEIIEKNPDFSGIPEKYKNIIEACLQKEAVKRPQSAEALLEMLSPRQATPDIEMTMPGTAEVKSNKPAPVVQQPKSNKKGIMYAIAGVVLLAVLGFGGFKWYQSSKAKELLDKGWSYYKNGEFKEAYSAYSDASDYNSGKAFYYLALMNMYGRGVERDYNKTKEYIDKAIDRGYEMAAYYYGDMYKNGWSVSVDTAKAVTYLKQSFDQVKELAKKEDVEAMHLYGLLSLDPMLGSVDSLKSFEMVKKATGLGHPIARNNLANWYKQGIGVEEDCDEALKLYKEGLDINFDRSINELGNVYYYGCGDIEVDYSKAEEYYEIAANQGNIQSQYLLGVIHHYGRGKSIDKDEALVWYTRSADGDHIPAFNALGIIYYEKENFEKAKEWYLKAAKKNNIYGAYNLGLLYNNDDYSKKNIDSSNFWYKKSALLGHSGAMVKVGYNFNKGIGMKKDIDSAFYWYEKAALKGYMIGEYNLGIMYENGTGCEQNYTTAKKWYDKALAQDYSFAYHALGNLYYNGHIGKDYTKARELYRKAADRDVLSAQYLLGYMMEYGQGGAVNFSGARKWYLKAAQKGHADAQQRLGNLYATGKGGKVDEANGFIWIRKSANQNNTEGQRRLGICYYYGIGPKKSKSLARTWLTKSCNGGNKRACEQIEQLL